jgi:small-conductance mechanosensitive channel
VRSLFLVESDKLNDQFVKGKEDFDSRLVMLTDKLLSFEKIVRQATQTQKELKESKQKLKSEIHRLRSELKLREAQESIKENTYPTEMAQFSELQNRLRDSQELLKLERSGAESRVRELLDFTKYAIDIDLFIDNWSRSFIIGKERPSHRKLRTSIKRPCSS